MILNYLLTKTVKMILTKIYSIENLDEGQNIMHKINMWISRVDTQFYKWQREKDVVYIKECVG